MKGDHTKGRDRAVAKGEIVTDPHGLCDTLTDYARELLGDPAGTSKLTPEEYEARVSLEARPPQRAMFD